MSHASIELQKAAVAALLAQPGLAELSGVYDGAPPRAAFPYAVISEGLNTDWSTKTEAGREVRLAVTLWDDNGEALRLLTLMGQAADALANLPRDLPGWRIASNVFLRSFISRDANGPWAGLVEVRVRLLST